MCLAPRGLSPLLAQERPPLLLYLSVIDSNVQDFYARFAFLVYNAELHCAMRETVSVVDHKAALRASLVYTLASSSLARAHLYYVPKIRTLIIAMKKIAIDFCEIFC